ncbi:unnamed protein product, partial [Discosporangium mesarthrocarpum]
TSSPPQHFPPPSRHQLADSFIIRHYAGPVRYSVIGFLEKNADPLWRGILPPRVKELLLGSTRAQLLRFGCIDNGL